MRQTHETPTFTLDDRQLAVVVGLCLTACRTALAHAPPSPSALFTRDAERVSLSHEQGTLDANALIGAPTAPRDGSAQEHVDESATPVAPPRLLVTVEQAAKVLAIGRSLMYELVSREEVASVKIGRARRIAVAALEEYVMRQRTGSPYAWERPSTGWANGPGKEGDDAR